MVKFPKYVVSLGAILVFSIFSGTAWADLSPHGRPGNLRTLPGVSLGISGGVGDATTQQSLFFEGKFSHRFMVIAEVAQANSEVDDVAINGDLDVEFTGSTFGFYYQLSAIRNTHLTVAFRHQEGESIDDAVILSGASRVNLEGDSSASEIALLVEHKTWARGNWQPYAGIGFRVTETTTDINTTGGRDITTTELTENTGELTAGLHYQRNLLSWFLEASASSSDDDPLQVHLGLRYGFFHRKESNR